MTDYNRTNPLNITADEMILYLHGIDEGMRLRLLYCFNTYEMLVDIVDYFNNDSHNGAIKLSLDENGAFFDCIDGKVVVTGDGDKIYTHIDPK